jgi:hypothetical protein
MKSKIVARLRMTGVITVSMLAGSLMTGAAFAYQGHMFGALHALERARSELAVAIPDKGGYRAQAITLVDQAISAVHAGISVGGGA